MFWICADGFKGMFLSSPEETSETHLPQLLMLQFCFPLCILNANVYVFQFLFSFFLILKFSNMYITYNSQDLRLISVLVRC